MESRAHGTETKLSALAGQSVARKRPAFRPGTGNGGSALPRLEAAVGLVDDVDPALAPHEAVVAVATAQRFQRVTDFHDALWMPCLRCVLEAPPPPVNAAAGRGDRRRTDLWSGRGESRQCTAVPTVF